MWVVDVVVDERDIGSVKVRRILKGGLVGVSGERRRVLRT